MDWRALFNSTDDYVLDNMISYIFLLCNFEKSIPLNFLLFNYYNFLIIFFKWPLLSALSNYHHTLLPFYN